MRVLNTSGGDRVKDRHKGIVDFAVTMVNQEELMWLTTYYNFESGNRKIALKKKHAMILDAFCHKHVGQYKPFDVWELCKWLQGWDQL